jgi:uncharacterized protein HemY
MSNDKTLRDAMLDTVLNQINTNDPPAARETYDRLVDEGASNSQALNLMAAALREEMAHMLDAKVEFDNARYTKRLAKLKIEES